MNDRIIGFFLFLILACAASCVTTRGPATESYTVADTNWNEDESEESDEGDMEVQTRLDDVQTQSAQTLMANPIGLSWPLKNGRITQHFDLAKRRPHLGVDLAATRGSAILSSHDGQVIYAGNGFHGYGKMVIVEFGDRWATLYSHLSKIKVREGQQVKRGQSLGVIGRTGNATGVHLHFEIRYFRQPIDPLKFLPQGPSYVSYFN